MIWNLNIPSPRTTISSRTINPKTMTNRIIRPFSKTPSSKIIIASHRRRKTTSSRIQMITNITSNLIIIIPLTRNSARSRSPRRTKHRLIRKPNPTISINTNSIQSIIIILNPRRSIINKHLLSISLKKLLTSNHTRHTSTIRRQTSSNTQTTKSLSHEPPPVKNKKNNKNIRIKKKRTKRI